MTRKLLVLGSCVLLFGCNAVPPETTIKAPSHTTAGFEIVPWNWADYSNRVWISVSGVGVEGFRANSGTLKKVNFSYSPNTGKSAAEAIAISSFDMISGGRSEQLLLKVLFGMEGSSLSDSNLLSDGKAFHIYTFKTHAGATNTVFFDVTMYFNLF